MKFAVLRFIVALRPVHDGCAYSHYGAHYLWSPPKQTKSIFLAPLAPIPTLVLQNHYPRQDYDRLLNMSLIISLLLITREKG